MAAERTVPTVLQRHRYKPTVLCLCSGGSPCPGPLVSSDRDLPGRFRPQYFLIRTGVT
jgi:hypothetical protein